MDNLMIGDKICIRFINSVTYEEKTVEKSSISLKYVEQLIHSVLEDENVAPVCRYLFGLRITNGGPWLAPNTLVQSFAERCSKRRPNNEPKLEIRVRFQPACLKTISIIDKITFNIIFAQAHQDFMTTRFNEEERDFVLLNESVLALVALNLVRHLVENNISVDVILKKVNPKDFIPKRAPRWQRALLFSRIIAEPINLQKSIRIGYERFGNDLNRIKREFIELFWTKVAPDHSSETHSVQQIIKSNSNPAAQILSPTTQIRVRYSQPNKEGSSRCLVEICSPRSRSKKTAHHSCKRALIRDIWEEICDIETISHATLHDCDVQVVSTKSGPNTLRFKSPWQAKSFLSAIDGYYRLVRRWGFNICREVASPELQYLNRIGCYGPIGYETSWCKLAKHRRPGSYIVRQCMEISHRYIIDTLLNSRVMLTIDVDNNPQSNIYSISGHSASSKRIQLIVKTDRDNYTTLDCLIRGIEIRVECDPDNEGSSYALQLRNNLAPEEGDDYPALMLSRSRKKTNSEQSDGSNTKRSIEQSACLIPHKLITYSGQQFPAAGNELKVELAKIQGDGERQVVIKSFFSDDTSKSSDSKQHINCAFHFCPNGHGDLEMIKGLRPSQLRIADWIFVQSGMFAETIGYIISGSIVQEYFPLGRLDTFLNQQVDVGQLVKLYASLQLAEALMFLCERRIIHGKIRCRNIMVKQANPIQIKLTDPLGSLDLNQDQAFIPPEYFSSSVQVCVRNFYTGLDVWAAGTTIWQIFNHGIPPPPGRFANTLTQTRNCPDKVWSLIESCWSLEANSRSRPATLCRDLFGLMAWEQGSHDYFYISENANGSHTSQRNSPARTARSSLSDLSSLRTNESSAINSPISVSTNGSQANLLAQHATNITSSLPRHSSSSHVGYSSPNGPMSSGSRPLIRRPLWAHLGSFKRGVRRCQLRSDDLAQHQRMEFADIFGSNLSLESSSNNCTTETTDALDIQSISEAFERCIWHVDSKRLKLGVEIGRGSSGVVIKGVMTQPDGQEQVVAVKTIQKDNSVPLDFNRIEDLKREFDILKNLDHTNIVKTLGYANEAHMLIFEYMPLGSLLSCIRNLPRHEDLAAMPLEKYGLDISNGMEYLESMRIVHRDLALRNILLKSRNEVKICDFGLAQALGIDNHYKIETDRALPLKWYSPETLTSWVFTNKSDVWSYGVVLWEIYSGGDSPNYSGTYADLSEILKHERLALPKDCPRKMYDLMLSCWKYDPEERLSFKQIRQTLELSCEEASVAIHR